MLRRQRYLLPVTVFVLLRDGDRFCAIRRANTGWQDGNFSLPGGALEEGETLIECAAREAREEVGAMADLSWLRHAHTMHCRTRDEAWVGHFFVAERWEGTPSIREPHKHADLRWAGLSDLPQPFVPYVEAAVVAIRDGVTYSQYGW